MYVGEPMIINKYWKKTEGSSIQSFWMALRWVLFLKPWTRVIKLSFAEAEC